MRSPARWPRPSPWASRPAWTPSRCTKPCARASSGRRLTFDGLLEQFLPGKYDPPDFALKLATKDVKLATALGRELGVPMRICNLAYAEMVEACNRGWEGRKSRVVMVLQEERAGVTIAADPERVKQAAERAKSG